MYCAHATAQCEGTRTNGTYDICTLSYKYTHILISCYFFHFSGLIFKKCIISLLTGPCFLPTPLLMRSWDQERYEIAIMSKWFICLDLIMSNIKITTYSHSHNIILFWQCCSVCEYSLHCFLCAQSVTMEQPCSLKSCTWILFAHVIYCVGCFL